MGAFVSLTEFEADDQPTYIGRVHADLGFAEFSAEADSGQTVTRVYDRNLGRLAAGLRAAADAIERALR